MVELLFTSHNRLHFVQATFRALLEHTDWSRVSRLHVLDDHSRDGTAEWLSAAIRVVPCETRFDSRRFGGPVAGLNNALDHCQSDVLGKIDSDLIVCPGWLDAMVGVLDSSPSLDALGMEPGFGGNVAPLDVPRTVEKARWIGGLGLIRTRVFRRNRPIQSHRYFGWTNFQRQHCRSGWITPALPVFLLDLLPFEPWMSLTDGYVRNDWQRPLHREPGRYDDSMRGFWEWWLE